jgi:hypothetical protein
VKQTVYRDDEGLRNLLAQVQDLQSTTIAVGYEGNREWSIGSKLKLGLGKILGNLGFPEVEMGGESAIKRSKKTSEKREFVETTEAIYRNVLRELSGRDALYADAYNAWCAARVSMKGIFCEFEEEFVPTGWTAEGDAWWKFANEHGALVLHSYDDRSMMLGMGLSKTFGTHDGRITPAGHLGMKFRSGKARLRVFGIMDSGKYIKPYLVTYS